MLISETSAYPSCRDAGKVDNGEWYEPCDDAKPCRFQPLHWQIVNAPEMVEFNAFEGNRRGVFSFQTSEELPIGNVLGKRSANPC
jgi:hypothetical protein